MCYLLWNLVDGFADCRSHVIGEVDGYGVTYHLVSVVDVIVYEMEVVREGLYPGYLPYRHPAVEVFLSFNELLLVRLDLNHFRGLWMELALSSACLYGESRLIPCPYAIT